MRSYRELPLRLFEFGTVYRYEKSGVVHGLTRVRGMTQDDAHIFCTREQIVAELDARARVRARPAARLRARRLLPRAVDQAAEGKAVGTDEEWDEATEALREVGRGRRPRARARRGRRRVLRPEDLGAGARRDRPHVADVDDPARLPAPAALRARVRRRRQRAPPAGHDPPRAVRRRSSGSSRILVEHYAGAFPAWLAPVQVDGAARSPTATTTTRARSSSGCGPTASASRWSTRTPTRSARASGARRWRRCRTCSSSGDDDVEHGTVGVNRRGSDEPERGVPSTTSSPRLAAEVVARQPAQRHDASSASGPGGAPTYIEGVADAPEPRRRDECLFCGSRPRTPTRGARARARTSTSFAVMNAYPYTSGHLMVAPLRHEATLAGPRRATRPPR